MFLSLVYGKLGSFQWQGVAAEETSNCIVLVWLPTITLLPGYGPVLFIFMMVMLIRLSSTPDIVRRGIL